MRAASVAAAVILLAWLGRSGASATVYDADCPGDLRLGQRGFPTVAAALAYVKSVDKKYDGYVWEDECGVLYATLCGVPPSLGYFWAIAPREQ